MLHLKKRSSIYSISPLLKCSWWYQGYRALHFQQYWYKYCWKPLCHLCLFHRSAMSIKAEISIVSNILEIEAVFITYTISLNKRFPIILLSPLTTLFLLFLNYFFSSSAFTRSTTVLVLLHSISSPSFIISLSTCILNSLISFISCHPSFLCFLSHRLFLSSKPYCPFISVCSPILSRSTELPPLLVLPLFISVASCIYLTNPNPNPDFNWETTWPFPNPLKAKNLVVKLITAVWDVLFCKSGG